MPLERQRFIEYVEANYDNRQACRIVICSIDCYLDELSQTAAPDEALSKITFKLNPLLIKAVEVNRHVMEDVELAYHKAGWEMKFSAVDADWQITFFD